MPSKDIFHGMVHERELLGLIKEYEERESLEAKIVKDADTIDVELELREIDGRGHSLGKLWKERRNKSVFPRLYTQSAKKFWLAIQDANPHDWHNKSPKNRFAGGDWRK